jgi:hypothetical protein
MKALISFVTLALSMASLAGRSAFANGRASAYESIKDPRCLNAIHQVHSDIENRLGGDLQDVQIYSPASESPAAASPIPERQQRIVFNLNTQWSRGLQATQQAHNANQALTSSPQLTKKYTEQVLSACPDVGSVVFYMWEWGVGWSVGSDSNLVQDRCVYPSQGRSFYIWGEIGCT